MATSVRQTVSCFCVCEQMYGLIWLTDLRSQMDSIDLLIMLTSAVCHDLDHTGYNNAYQVDPKQSRKRLIQEVPMIYFTSTSVCGKER